jgi:hypothetical protein
MGLLYYDSEIKIKLIKFVFLLVVILNKVTFVMKGKLFRTYPCKLC